MTPTQLPYKINDADNHFNEPGDCFERYIDPRHADLAFRTVADPNGEPVQLFAGRPSKFHSRQVTFSPGELEKILGDTANLGVCRTASVQHGELRLDMIPGMLLKCLNPLRACRTTSARLSCTSIGTRPRRSATAIFVSR